jgi:hypothetical protein
MLATEGLPGNAGSTFMTNALKPIQLREVVSSNTVASIENADRKGFGRGRSRFLTAMTAREPHSWPPLKK